jgi:hypothetical protein
VVSKLGPRGTSATEWPIVPAPGDYDDGEFGWMKIGMGKPKYSEKTYPSATLSTTNPTWPDPGSNPSRRGGKPATNRLSYGAAIIIIKNNEVDGLRLQSASASRLKWLYMWQIYCKKQTLLLHDNLLWTVSVL